MPPWPHPRLIAPCALLLAALATLATRAAEPSQLSDAPNPPADKSAYHLFHPVPRSLMRDFSTDRPDRTESAYTVDAGHFQVEMDLISYGQERYNPERSRTDVEVFSAGLINLKVGLLNQVDWQWVIPTYTRERTRDRQNRTTTTREGFGNLISRLKINCWGNDGGSTAFAVMPFVSLPTSQHQLGNGSVEGGVILPLAVSLPWGWNMGLMSELDLLRDSSGSGYHVDVVQSLTFSHAIIGKLSGYLEVFTAISTERDSGWEGTFDLGLTYALTEDIQLDAGVNLGFTRAAQDLNPFLGLSIRF